MGGKALSVETRRLDREEFESLWETVSEKLRAEGRTFELVKSYRTKPDFGDMDVLIMGEKDPHMIERVFSPTETYNNGYCISFDLNGFQVDFVHVNEVMWECANVFFAYNDLGNLMGKLARFLRVKWGYQGLRYTVYNDIEEKSRRLGEILLSRDPRRIFEFLGFDYDRFLEGFDTIEDVFEYVINSRYFNHECFMPESLNASQRFRDTKRAVYEQFMEHIQTIPVREVPRPTHDEAIHRANAFFPEASLVDEFYTLHREDHLDRFAASKFNGGMVMREIGLSGKELGAAMKRFKQHFGDQYRSHILETPYDELLIEFRQLALQQ